MKWLMMIKHSEADRSQPIPEGLLKAMGEGFRVRLSGGKLKVSDGPFTEAKELVGGFAIVEVPSREKALEVAKKFMDLHRVHWPAFEGESECRALEEY